MQKSNPFEYETETERERERERERAPKEQLYSEKAWSTIGHRVQTVSIRSLIILNRKKDFKRLDVSLNV